MTVIEASCAWTRLAAVLGAGGQCRAASAATRTLPQANSRNSMQSKWFPVIVSGWNEQLLDTRHPHQLHSLASCNNYTQYDTRTFHQNTPCYCNACPSLTFTRNPSCC